MCPTLFDAFDTDDLYLRKQDKIYYGEKMVQITKLDNGLTLVTGSYPSFRSVAAGFWVGAGSAFESDAENGISHFTEHVMYKGTAELSAARIAERFEDLGASFNAFTSKEATCFYFKSIDEKFGDCFALLSHILYESLFDDAELDKERKVIAEEIHMVEDEPEEICYDLLAGRRYEGTRLANTILGPVDNVMRFRGDDVREYTRRMYTPDNIVISMVGNIRHEDALKLVEKYVLPRCGCGRCAKEFPENVEGGGYAEYKKDFEQVNLAIGFPSVPFDDDLTAVQSVVSFCFGTGMSSRLFQRLREQQGLVYNVYTSCSTYKRNGNFGIYVNTSGGNLGKAVSSVAEEIKILVRDGLTAAELERAKMQLKSSMLFGIENILSVMSSCGKYALYTGKAYDIDKSIAQVENVTLGDVADFCRSGVFNRPVSVAYVGKKQFVEGKDIYSDLLSGLRA